MSNAESFSGTEVAIVGMAGRYPGARTLDEFWRNVRDGVESVTFFTEDELRAAGELPERIGSAGYVPAQPMLEDVDKFDAGFFGMSARDAAVMDPQHRIFLEVAWEALEQAGYAPDAAPGAVGVFAACGQNAYMMHHLVRNAEVMDTVGEWLVRHTGNDMNFLATRASYQMNLRGPSLTVQTACSSALVAIHLACQHLLSGECDMALAGASTVLLPQGRGYLFQRGEILAADGHCRPFDADATGTIFGSGAGCVVLRRLSDALEHGDQVLAVIRGSAVNNDGSDKVSYLAPSVEGQSRAISEALAVAGVAATSISYVEAHGTGTPMGDPIEVAALTRAFRAETDARGFCALGSVKANIGHLGEAAGMAGIMKTVLAMRHRTLPPSINFRAPNRELDLPSSPFYVNTTAKPWIADGPRRAGVTALGAGGTNVHVVLEEAPARTPSALGVRPPLLVLSARTPAALDRAAARLADHLDAGADLSLADAAYTLQLGRKHFAHRRSIVACDRAAASAALRAAPRTALAGARGEPSLVFMFPGGGAQYPGMGRALYEREPVYRAAFDECVGVLEPAHGARVHALVLRGQSDSVEQSRELEAPHLALPALFATEYAAATLLMASGLAPAAFIGHSMGEYVAACLAGVLSPRDAMRLVATRGRLFETLPLGGMLSVNLPEHELQPLLGAELAIAAANAPALCVASGPVGALEALERVLEARGVDVKRVPITVAAHSAMLEPILAEFRAACRRLRLSPPTVPFASNVTGEMITATEATDPEYWVRHLRSTVRFAEGVARLLADESRVFVEVGPGRTLASLARQHPSSPTTLPTLRHVDERAPDVEFLLGAVGRAWEAGARVDFARLHGAARRVALPSYPFERERHWIEAMAADVLATATKPMRKTEDLADWFYAPAWRRSAAPTAAPAGEGTWLLFTDDAGVAARIAACRVGRSTVLVTPGNRFAKRSGDRYSVRAGSRADFDALLEDLVLRGRDPEHIVHLWGVSAPRRGLAARLGGADEVSDFARAEALCFQSLLHLAQAMQEHERPRTLSIVTSGMQYVAANDAPDPAKALVNGPLHVIPREMPYVRTRGIDVDLGDGRPQSVAHVGDRVARELDAPPRDAIVAFRGVERWVRRIEPLRIEADGDAPAAVRTGATVLITGGLGGLGLELAVHLARTAQAKLVLIGRGTVPPRSDWAAFVAEHGPDDAMSRRIARLLEIEVAGGEVLPIAADVSDMASMQAAVRVATRRFGAVHVVVHAAGVIDDGLIATKTAADAAAVIAPKAKGALVLERVLRDEPIETFVVFSSVSAVLGLEGQVDYTAANAFLDAFAQRMQARGGPRAVAIAWNAWQDVGMAASLANRASAGALGGARTSAPAEGETLATLPFSARKDWLLSEHVVRGAGALLPGTAYLALASRAVAPALRRIGARDGVVELRDLTFLSPFVLKNDERRALRVRATPDGADAVRFTFESDASPDPHVVGRAVVTTMSPGPRVCLADLVSRCPRRVEVHSTLDQPFVRFGPRWANIERIHYGDGEAALELALPTEFVGDLADYQPHPAVMDMATGAAQALIPGFDQARDFYVPIGYGRVTLHRPMPARLWSHVRYVARDTPDLASFDVTLYDEAGEVLVEVRDFRMRRIGDAGVLAGPTRATAALDAVVRHGVIPAEGVEAFDRILSRELGGHVLASSVDVNAWAAQLDAATRAAVGTDGAGQARPAAERPPLVTSFVAPRLGIEAAIADIWGDLLGLARVGANDDFFDLGGQSLVAVRMFARIRSRYGVDLPLSVLFEAPTVGRIAAIVAAEAGVPLEEAPSPPAPTDAAPPCTPPASRAHWRSLVPMQREGAGRPFYVVAGMGGTLNNLRNLAIRMGTARPVYGLQPPGANDRKDLLYSVEALAETYVRQVRELQPAGPYSIAGYSGGGVVAFEMARQLTAAGERVALVGFIDSFSPALPRRSAWARLRMHADRAREQGPGYVIDTVRRRYGYQRGALTLRAGHALGALFPQHYRHESIQESWILAEAAYRPMPWEGRAILFRAREESATSLWSAFDVDEAYGWRRYLRGGVQLEHCPGNHATMCEEPNVGVLAAKISAALAAADHASADAHDGAVPEWAAR